MPEPTISPASYSIEKLLTQTVQPFPDLPAEEFEVLTQSIKDRGLLNPVLLTEDGYLFDGHQRLKAMLALGRKRISAEQVIIRKDVNRDNMIGHAYASNMVRRMLTTADKAARMHQCAAMGWSQRKIAKEFHMSQPGVSQLMAAYPPDGGVPEVVVTQGEDGKTYTRSTRKKGRAADDANWPAPPRPKPWQYGGASFKSMTHARKQLRILPTGLNEAQKAELAEVLEEFAAAIETFLEGLESM